MTAKAARVRFPAFKSFFDRYWQEAREAWRTRALTVIKDLEADLRRSRALSDSDPPTSLTVKSFEQVRDILAWLSAPEGADLGLDYEDWRVKSSPPKKQRLTNDMVTNYRAGRVFPSDVDVRAELREFFFHPLFRLPSTSAEEWQAQSNVFSKRLEDLWRSESDRGRAEPLAEIVVGGRPLRSGVVEYGRFSSLLEQVWLGFLDFIGLRPEMPEPVADGLPKVELAEGWRRLVGRQLGSQTSWDPNPDGTSPHTHLDALLALLTTPSRSLRATFFEFPFGIPVNAVALVPRALSGESRSGRSEAQARLTAYLTPFEDALDPLQVTRHPDSRLRTVLCPGEVGELYAAHALKLNTTDLIADWSDLDPRVGRLPRVESARWERKQAVLVRYLSGHYADALWQLHRLSAPNPRSSQHEHLTVCLADEFMCIRVCDVLNREFLTESDFEAVCVFGRETPHPQIEGYWLGVRLPYYRLGIAFDRSSSEWLEHLRDAWEEFLRSRTNWVATRIQAFFSQLCADLHDDCLAEPLEGRDRTLMVEDWLGFHRYEELRRGDPWRSILIVAAHLCKVSSGDSRARREEH